MLIDIISSLFIWIGVIFTAIAAIGLLRFPDFYIRMSAITKAATMGVGLIIFGIIIYFNDAGLAFRGILIIVFLLITSPIAAHIIARAAYEDNTPFWDKTLIDEFREQLKTKEAEAKFSDVSGREQVQDKQRKERSKKQSGE